MIGIGGKGAIGFCSCGDEDGLIREMTLAFLLVARIIKLGDGISARKGYNTFSN